MESSTLTKCINEIGLKHRAIKELLVPQTPLLEEPDPTGVNNGDVKDKFKRPLLDDLPPSKKRVKV